MIVLFEEKQIMDVKRFCFPGTMGQATILGVDKIYNLGPLHVTRTAFKNLSLARYDTRDHPLFMGPVLNHGNSDFPAFATFLSTISTALDTDNPILMRSDEEGALKNL